MAGNGTERQQVPKVNKIFSDTWSCTKVNTTKFGHKWTIDNIQHLFLKKPGKFVESATFSPKNDNELKWRLRAYPNGQDAETRDYFSIFLILIQCKRPPVSTMFELCIVGDKNVKMNRSAGNACSFGSGSTCGFQAFIEVNLLLNNASLYLPNNKLTIVCDISIVEDIRKISGKNNIGSLEIPDSRIFANNVGSLYENERFSDATLTVSGRDFKVHKAILAARSPVFSAMFEHDMQEMRENHVEITDIDHQVFVEVLRFIYTDNVTNIKAMATDLIVAADKYDLETLKLMCAKALYESLSTENAVYTFILADLHGAVDLKARTLDFVCAHTREILDSAVFKAMAVSYPHLTVEILDAVSLRRDGNADVSVPLVIENPYPLNCRFIAGSVTEMHEIHWLPLTMFLDSFSYAWHFEALNTKSLHPLFYFVTISLREIFLTFTS